MVSSEDNKCPDISGRYDITGERADKILSYEADNYTTWSAIPTQEDDNKIRPLHLYDVFPTRYFIFRGAITDATFVQILQPDENTLEVSFVNNKGLMAKKIYSIAKKEYACSPKGMSFPFGRGYAISGVAGGMAGPVPFASGIGNWGNYYLSKSIDGSLIIKEEGTAAALFIMMPAWRPYETWHRFKQARSP